MWRLSPELLRNEATRGRPLAAVFPPCRSRGTFLPLAGEGGGGGRPSSFLHRRSPRGSPLSNSPPRGERTPSSPGRDGAFVPPRWGWNPLISPTAAAEPPFPSRGKARKGGVPPRPRRRHCSPPPTPSRKFSPPQVRQPRNFPSPHPARRIGTRHR